uniref:MARVEL domain-containing protein n=1 Tax=Strigops habroptila TaxID=2489341 RepID=A0A672VAM9_STRHB
MAAPHGPTSAPHPPRCPLHFGISRCAHLGVTPWCPSWHLLVSHLGEPLASSGVFLGVTPWCYTLVSNLMSMLASPGVPPWCHPSVSPWCSPVMSTLAYSGGLQRCPPIVSPLGVHLNISWCPSWVSPSGIFCSSVVLSPRCPPMASPHCSAQHLLVFLHCVVPIVSPMVSPQDLLRAVSGTIIFLVVALVALAASRDALAATTFVSVILILSFLFAFDAFVTYRAEVAPAVGRAVGQREGVPPWLQCRGSWPAAC